MAAPPPSMSPPGEELPMNPQPLGLDVPQSKASSLPINPQPLGLDVQSRRENMVPPLISPPVGALGVPLITPPPGAGALPTFSKASSLIPPREKTPEPEEQTIRVICRKQGDRVVDKHIKPSLMMATIREELNHTASKPVKLFVNGKYIDAEKWKVHPGDRRVEFEVEQYEVMDSQERKYQLGRIVEAWKKKGEWGIGDVFKKLNDAYKDDRDFVKNALKVWPGVFKYVSDRLKGEWEFALPGVLHDPVMFKDCPERLKANKNFVLQVMQKHFMCIRDATDDLKSDKKFLLDAIRVNPHSFFAASVKLKDDYTFVRECMELSPECLRYASKAVKDAIANPMKRPAEPEPDPSLKRGRILTPAEILEERVRNGGTYS